jgi:hypothetical protein
MAVQVSYPGVYIEEFTPGAPIEGVGTSTAALLGTAQNGPLNEPTKITSWDAFLEQFGPDPVDGFYLWYAVRGFFENNGQVCYILRVSNGKFDFKVLNDRTSAPGKPTIRIQARMPGRNSAKPIKVMIADAHAVSTKLFRRRQPWPMPRVTSSKLPPRQWLMQRNSCLEMRSSSRAAAKAIRRSCSASKAPSFD